MKYTRKICAVMLALLTVMSVLAAAAPSRGILFVSAMEEETPAVHAEEASQQSEKPTVPKGGKYSEYEWQRSGSLEYVIDSGKAVVVSCDRDVSGIVSIPYRLGNCTVAAIADYAFSGCTGITKIDLPITVNYIGNCAFIGCSSLTAINLDTDRVELGYDPFAGCPAGIVIGRNADGEAITIGSLESAAPSVNLTTGGPTTAVNKSNIKYYDQIIEAIRKGLSVYEGDINLNGFEVTSEELYYIVDNIRAELPLETAAAAILGWGSVGGGSSGYVRNLHFNNDYDPTVETYQERYNNLAAKINPFVESMKGYSVYDQILFSHKFITDCGSYDYTYTYYHPYEYIIKGTGVCQSYTMSFAILLNMLEIPNSSVLSREMNHTWTIVWIDGEPYHIDSTWNDSAGANSKSYSTYYYLLNDSEMLEKGHYGWSPDYNCDSTTFSAWPRSFIPSSAEYNDGCWYFNDLDNSSRLYSSDIYGGSITEIDNEYGGGIAGLLVYNDYLYYVANDTEVRRYGMNTDTIETVITLTQAEINSCYYNIAQIEEINISRNGILSCEYNYYVNENGEVNCYYATGSRTADVSLDHDFEIRPTTLEAHSVGYTSAKLTWKPVDYVDGYNIYRCDRAGQSYNYIASVDRTKNTYTNTGLSTGTTYYYKVKAYCLTEMGVKITGSFSNYHTARPLPATPVVTAVRTSPSSVSVGWVKIYGATGYSVYRSESENGTYSFYAAMSGGDDTYYVDKNASSAKTYYYKVRAYRQMGSDKMFGNYSKATPAPASKLAAPTITARSVGYTSARIEWGKVPGAQGYSIYRCDVGGGTYSYLTSFDANTFTYTNTGLSTGTTYYYKVRAYVNVGGEKVFSAYSPCATARPIPATPVVDVYLTDEEDAVVVEWVPIYGASGYSVYISNSENGTYSFYYNLPSPDYVGLITSNLQPGRTYYFKVRAYRQMGSDKMFSNYSVPKSITVPWSDAYSSAPQQQAIKEQ